MSSKLKPWGKQQRYPNSGKRKENLYSDRQTVLIACEGQATEPNYFKSFPIDPAKIEIDGRGYNSDSLVEFAINKMKKAKDNKTPYLQVWCVFDRDVCQNNNIYRAFQLAKNNKIKIAYSNQAFELWFVLHFQYLNTACDRHELVKKLNLLIDGGYRKNQDNIYKLLDNGDHRGENQRRAICNAQKLEALHDRKDKLNNNPSTTVYKLVEALNKLIV